MGLTGKYNFPGMRKAGAFAFQAALASTVWGAKILASPFKPAFEKILELISEWMANKGLIVINVGAFIIEGEVDQRAFDKAFDQALEKVKVPGLSVEEMKAIDYEVIKAFRNFARVSKR